VPDPSEHRVIGPDGQLVFAPGCQFLYVVQSVFLKLIVVAVRKTKQETVQNVTYKVDLPGETKISEVKCKSCGGTLSAENVSLVNGAPMVNCPYCHTIYQLTEEPKW